MRDWRIWSFLFTYLWVAMMALFIYSLEWEIDHVAKRVTASWGSEIDGQAPTDSPPTNECP